MESDIRIYLIETAKELLRESGEKLTIERLISVYNKLITDMKVNTKDTYTYNKPAEKYIKQLQSFKSPSV